MSKKKPVIPVADIADDSQYRIVMAERGDLLGQPLYAGNEYIVSGAALQTLIDKVKDAAPV